MLDLLQSVTRKTQLPYRSVQQTVGLLNQGATVPFIARYRQAQTGNLDEEQIREIARVYKFYTELADRKQTILRTIEEQGKLTDQLRQTILACEDAHVLEDIYLPFKPKRRTKAMIALEQGLGPLAELIKTATTGDPDVLIRQFINGEICTRKEALQGAMYIIAEQIAEHAQTRARTRNIMQASGTFKSRKKKTDHKEAFKFDLYDEFELAVDKLKPHQLLALNRGESLGILTVSLGVDEEALAGLIARELNVNNKLIFKQEYEEAIKLSVSRYLTPSIEREVRKLLTEYAERHAARVFSQNLRNLLLQPPLMNRVVIGLDPGYASGCKVAVISEQGDYLEGTVIYPTPPRNQTREAEQIMLELIDRYNAQIIAIGNGTASRETELFIAELIKRNKLQSVKYLITNEAGASVYSASDYARKEFPNLDAAQRGNISIARRVQDPLAELVKIDPKSLGVGLYQHDVDQSMLETELEAVVESCVNQVGVDLNTASVKLLSFVSGLNERLANEIVNYRSKIRQFTSRNQLKEVKGIGERTFEQAAGFLRIRQGTEPLDNTAIHPESYDKVRALSEAVKVPLSTPQTLASKLQALTETERNQLLERLSLDMPTYTLIVQNLARPGRDPREDVPPPLLRSDVLRMEDLTEGMVLNGTVRNVVDFGAFIDIGLKNDALLHISRMSKDRRRVNNPLEVVQVGEVLQVRIDKVETDKERVSLALV